MKILFMGTPDFAVSSLNALVANHSVVAVVTQPDKSRDRGKKIQHTPVKQRALELDIPVLQPEKINEAGFADKLRTFDVDIFIVAAYGQIISEEILNIPRYGSINVHGSLLPKYRGAAPIQWSVINGEEKTGITIMYMEKGLDTGDMILKREVPILLEYTGGMLHDIMAEVGAKTLIDALKLIEKGDFKREKQDESISSYAPMITKETGHIDWNKSSKEIVNLIRGLNPQPIAYIIYSEQVLKIWKAENFEIGGYNNKENGEIVEVIKDKGFVVKTSDGCILITEIQKLGKNKLLVSEFLRGNKIEIGKILS